MKRIKHATKKVYKQVPNSGTWLEAIADAEEQLKEAKSRVRRLKAAISVLKDRAESGQPFPGAA